MIIFLFVILGITCVTVVFFKISFSPVKSEFIKLQKELSRRAVKDDNVFTMVDIKDLPKPIQKYFIHCGYIGKEKISCIKATFSDVTFSLGKQKPPLKIDYVLCNLTKEPMRIAFIDTSMYGVPFQGIDSFIDGIGSMKGVIAKLFTLFDQRGAAMDKASLVTYLAEFPVIPSIALQDFVKWEEIDEFHAKAIITFKGISGSGVFTFNEKGEMVSFETDDRENTSMDGKTVKAKWTAVCSDYKDFNGVLRPNRFKGLWNYPEGDFEYFDGIGISIEYNY